MTDRIIDLSQSPAYLRVKYEQLNIERKSESVVTTPLSEVAVLILTHPQITCTQSVINGIMEHGGTILVCNRQNLPSGMMLPLVSHHTQTERFAAQAAIPIPIKKRLWKQIIQHKVRAQSALLIKLYGEDRGIAMLARSVKSGDSGNIESQASVRYWRALFHDPDFRRRQESHDQNQLLNYGYAVLRAIVARAVCASGLHPSLGLHHHNKYNPYCLADDIMEPYRPLVDETVVEFIDQRPNYSTLDSTSKAYILQSFIDRYHADGESRSLFDIVARTTESLTKVFMKENDRLYYPGEMRRASDTN